MELFETTANHEVLRALSTKFGGETVFPAQLTSILEKIKNNQTVKPVIYQTTSTSPLINLKWIFAAGVIADGGVVLEVVFWGVLRIDKKSL